MAPLENRKCYVCQSPATSHEHAPPRCFFPKGERDGLITVPSCDTHNYELEGDAEYVRGVITMAYQTKDSARRLSATKVIPSLSKHKRLARDILVDPARIRVGEDETAIFTVNLPRYKRLITHIAYAMYFHFFQRTYCGGWEIISPSLVPRPEEEEAVFHAYQKLQKLVQTLAPEFRQLATANPQIFQCHLGPKNDFELVFKFIFFGGFEVVALSLPPWRKPII